MAPAGEKGDTLYFRYYGETSDCSGTMSSTISYYTTLTGNAGITYDYDEVSYTVDSDLPEMPDPEEPEPDNPEIPDTPSDSEDPAVPELPNIPSLPNTDLIDDGLVYLPPLGEIAFVPNTGIVSTIVSGLLGDDFADIILSQAFILIILLIFCWQFRNLF